MYLAPHNANAVAAAADRVHANTIRQVISALLETESSHDQADIPETSIVIRAFNEERWLPEVFAAIERQRYRDFEVLLVDSGSMDRTREIAAANGARIMRLRSEDFTFGHSLNVGIAGGSRSPYVAILSAHAIPADEGWLERLVAPLRASPTSRWCTAASAATRSRSSRRHATSSAMFPSRPQRSGPGHPFANNANSAIKRELWAPGAFDKGLPGLEDIEWAKHWLDAGYRVLYEPAACIIHVHTETWARFAAATIARAWPRAGSAPRSCDTSRARCGASCGGACATFGSPLRQTRFASLAGEICGSVTRSSPGPWRVSWTAVA